MNKYLKYGIMGFIAASLSAILFNPAKEKDIPTYPRSYEEIIASGVLRAVTEYNSVSFHSIEDTIGGLHYELLQAFAKDQGLQIEVTPEMSIEKRIKGIQNGTYDILANNVLVNKRLRDSILFTHPILLEKQVLVQRKAQTENDSTHIKSLLKLAHKTLHVAKGSPAIRRIRHLSHEIGDTIYIQEVEKYGPEQLLAMVANGDIDYAVCDHSIAQAALEYLPQLDIDTDISFSQFYSWGVSYRNTVLLDSLNAWLETYKQSSDFRNILKKYSTNYKR